MQNDSSMYHLSRLNGKTSEHSRDDFIDKLRPCINYLLPLPLHLNFSRKETTIVLNLAKYFFPLISISTTFGYGLHQCLEKNKNYEK